MHGAQDEPRVSLEEALARTEADAEAVLWAAAAATRPGGSTVRVITENGRDKLYYGISVSPTT